MGFRVLEAHRQYSGGVGRQTRDIQAEINGNTNQRSDNVKFATVGGMNILTASGNRVEN